MIEVKHKGYEIKYDRDDALWKCPELKLQAEQLKRVEHLIDQGILDERRVNVPALMIKQSGWYDVAAKAKLVPVIVTTITEDGKECWVSEGNSRSKEYLANVFPDNEETRTAFAKWIQLSKAADAAAQLAGDTRKAMKGYTVAQLKKARVTPAPIRGSRAASEPANSTAG